MTTTPGSAPAKPRSRGPAIAAIVIGALLLLGGPIAGIAGGAIAGAMDALTQTKGSQAPVTAELEAGDTRYLMAPAANLGSIEAGDCQVTGPAGQQLEISYAPASALNTHILMVRYESFARFSVPATGAYRLSCESTTDVAMMRPLDVEALFGPIALGTVIGCVAGVGGLVVLIIGIVRVTSRR